MQQPALVSFDSFSFCPWKWGGGGLSLINDPEVYLNGYCEKKNYIACILKEKKVTAQLAFVGVWSTFSENAQIYLVTGQLQTDTQKKDGLFPSSRFIYSEYCSSLVWIFAQIGQSQLDLQNLSCLFL